MTKLEVVARSIYGNYKWENFPENRPTYLETARNAILGAREPTEAMLDSAPISRPEASDTYRAMIDAILNEAPEPDPKLFRTTERMARFDIDQAAMEAVCPTEQAPEPACETHPPGFWGG